jgi:hypothetical protein
MSVAYGNCRVQLEKQHSSGWRPVLQTVCFDFAASDTILPGDSITRSVILGGSLVRQYGPSFAVVDSIPGIYRMVLDFRFITGRGFITGVARDDATSNPFRVQSPP